MHHDNINANKKERRIYKRIIVISSIIILFIFVSGKAFQKEQTPTVLNKNPVIIQPQKISILREIQPILTNTKINYDTDRYSRNRWKRFVCQNNPLGNNNNETDYFEVSVTTNRSDSVTVQTLAGNRVSHSRLFGPGARIVDGNGYEIRMESFKNGKYTFAVSSHQPRALLKHVYFKFSNNCQVKPEPQTVKVNRVGLKLN